LNGGEGDCSHIKACMEWVLAEGALEIDTRNEREPLSERALRFPAYLGALADRKAREVVEGEEVFGRLA